MRQVILDTSFIMSCAKQKIDFFHELDEEGMKILVPRQAIRELEGLGAKLALKLIDKNRKKFEVVHVEGKDADEAIIRLARKNKDAVVATLDQGLKKKIKNRKMVIRQRKRLEIL